MVKKKILVDTSVIIKWLSNDKEHDLDAANKLLEDALNEKIELIVPELSKYEVGNVLLFSKKLSFQKAAIVLEKFYTLPITFISESEELAKDTYSIAYEFNVTYYDASFLSLAKQQSAILITENIKHRGKAKDILVKFLKDF